MSDEADYDRLRMAQWLADEPRRAGLSRRQLFRLSAGVGLAAIPALGWPGVAEAQPVAERSTPVVTASGPIVKPLPPELFNVFGSNAEMRWEAMRGQGYLVPIDRFFVRDHTSTPLLDADTWRLKLFGTGLRGAPTIDNPVEFTYQELRDLPAETVTAFVECAGNGRGFFTTQQNETVPGTPWHLGAVGVARWRGVRLAAVLERAGLTRAAVDILPQGLDPDFVSAGVNLGKVRRPLPVAKALRDALLVYEMNGATLPPDHGFPVRLIVPSWVGISSIKWVGQIEVSDVPLFSPFNTQLYKLFGPSYPTDGAPFTHQVVKSAFELPFGATVASGRHTVLHGRSWSGNGRIRTVEVSTDGGATWRRAQHHGPDLDGAWQRWQIPWRPETTGAYTLRARATDVTGTSQPDQTVFNTMGYLFDAVVDHPVTVT
jgi:DMSO/TMAO reductase YedYZ molybdopterin-dependent catalytic subunit